MCWRTRNKTSGKVQNRALGLWVLLASRFPRSANNRRSSSINPGSSSLWTFSPRLANTPESGARLAFPPVYFWQSGTGRTQCLSIRAGRGAMSQSANWLNLAQAASQCFQHASPRTGSRSVAALCYVNAAMIRGFSCGLPVRPYCLLVVAPQDATLGGTIREPEIGSYAVWLYGDRDTASVMQWGPATRVFPCPKDSRRTMRRRYVRYDGSCFVSKNGDARSSRDSGGELMRRGPRHARKRPHTKQKCKRWKRWWCVGLTLAAKARGKRRVAGKRSGCGMQTQLSTSANERTSC